MNNEVLKDIFKQQADLNKRVGKDYTKCNTDEELTVWIRDYLSALSNEMEELRSWTNFRWWKQYDKPIDRHQCKVEIIDMLHFLISLALPLMDADEFVDLYWAKKRLNDHRIDVGYNQEYEDKFKQPGNEDNDYLLQKVQCSRCAGRGYTWGYDKNAENNICQECKGTGYVADKTKEPEPAKRSL